MVYKDHLLSKSPDKKSESLSVKNKAKLAEVEDLIDKLNKNQFSEVIASIQPGSKEKATRFSLSIQAHESIFTKLKSATEADKFLKSLEGSVAACQEARERFSAIMTNKDQASESSRNNASLK
jgi:hypothetical protein